MPATPPPLGETPSPRPDVRWIEPIVFEPVPQSTPQAEIPARGADIRQPDVRWVEFDLAEAAVRDREAQLWFVSRVPPQGSRPERELAEPALIEPVFIAFFEEDERPERRPGQDEIAVDLDDEYQYVHHDEAPPNPPAANKAEHAEDAAGVEEEAAAAAVYIPEEDGSLDLFPSPSARNAAPVKPRPAVMRRRDFAGSHTKSLSRGALAAGVLAMLAAVFYYGGEHLAGLAGAMTPPQTSVDELAPAVAAAPRNQPHPGPAAAPSPAPAPASVPAPMDEDAARAAAFMERAKAGDMAAQYNVAVFYATGKGLAKDLTSAAAWFAKAAEAGSASAQFNLGVMYQQGRGVRQDPAAAFMWYRRAADRHYAPAQFNLGVAYAAGQGTPSDPVAAARWYHQAAIQGLVAAMFNFAILYEKGEGVERSPIDAYAWYWLAAQRGDADAEKRAGELSATFDAGRKRTAQTLAERIAGTIQQSMPEMTPLPAAADSDSTPPPVAASNR